MKRESVAWLLLEGSAIVVSILLAFAIDAWWQDRQEAARERELLSALRDETLANRELLELAIKFNEEAIASADRLFELAGSTEPRDPAEVDSLLGDLFWVGVMPWSDGATQAIVAHGNLNIVSDPVLRARIASRPAGRRWMEMTERWQIEDNNRLFDYLARAGNLPQVSAVAEAKGVPGGLPRHGQHAAPSVGPTTDHTLLLDDKRFLNVVYRKRGSHADALNAYAFAKPIMDEILQMIEAHLGDYQ